MTWRTTIRILILTMFLTSSSWGQNRTITLLHLNDTHSNLSPLGPRTANLEGTVGGIARAATVIEATRLLDKDALVLHAGDVFIGDIFFNTTFGVPEFKILNGLGVDAMAVGNHEFDLGPSTLLSSLDQAFHGNGFPLLSANTVLDAPEVQPLEKYIFPYTVKTVNGVKIGIFGLTTPLTNMISQPSPAFIDTNFIPIAAQMVQKLKGLNCSVIILLSHLGFNYDQLVASYVPGIDFIIGGHDHYVFRHPVPVVNPSGDTTYIMQAGAFYEYIGKLKFTVRHGKARIVDYDLIHLNRWIPQDPLIAMKVKALEKQIEAVYGPMFSKKIACATADFPEIADSLLNPGYHDTPAGNLVTDAFRAYTGTDVAITVGGSLAEPLHHGPLVGDDIFRLVGYGFNTDNGLGFRLATFKITGLNLIIGLEFGLSSIELDDENFIQVSGMSYAYAVDQPAGSRVVGVKIGGEDIDFTKTYTVTTNEFLLMVLKDYVGPLTGLTVEDPQVLTGVAEYSVVEGYVEALGTISPSIEGRVTAVQIASQSRKLAQQTAPKEFDLAQNYPNPFNPSTTISFSLPKSSFVTIKIYDMLGREVTTLASGGYAAGTHSLVWNADRFASGIYFFRIDAGQYHNTKKMILMK